MTSYCVLGWNTYASWRASETMSARRDPPGSLPAGCASHTGARFDVPRRPHTAEDKPAARGHISPVQRTEFALRSARRKFEHGRRLRSHRVRLQMPVALQRLPRLERRPTYRERRGDSPCSRGSCGGSDQEETLLPACLAQGPHPRIPPHVSALGVDYFDAVGRRELGDPRKDLFGPSNVSVAMDPIRSKRTLASHLLPLDTRLCWTLSGRKADRQPFDIHSGVPRKRGCFQSDRSGGNH